jgi:glycosyltransferase involved in cell wall biosynthesis
MACGTPVIAYPRGSVPEIIEEGRTGFLVNDTQAAARAVEHVSKISREECRQRFEERFSATRMAKDYLGVYKGLTHFVSEILHLGDGVSVG